MKLFWHIILLIALLIALLFTGVSGSFSSAQAQGVCIFTASAEHAQLYQAPLTDPTQQIGPIPLGVGYQIERSHGEHFYITLDGITGGWVDRRSGGVSGACDTIPVDPTPLSAFPTVCTLTLTQAAPIYSDLALTQSHGTLQPDIYVVTQRAPVDAANSLFYVRIGHAWGGWVPLSEPQQLSAGCNTILVTPPNTTATALDNARAWSAPNVQTGEVLFDLAAGTVVLVVQGPVSGPIRLDTDAVGNWYQVVVGDQRPVWMWEARLDFASQPAPIPQPVPNPATYYTLENARLWTVPDVKTGSITAYLPPNIGLTVIAGPVRGPIRYDTDDLGDWYYVQPVGDQAGGYLPGWIWSARFTQ